MAQQINLCTSMFITEERHFSAATLAQSLGVLVLFGALLSGGWVWSLDTLGKGYQQTVLSNQKEVARLQAAIAVNKANAGPADAALVQEVEARKKELLQRQQLLAEMRRGLVREGWGHSARLQLVAQTIPSQAWVTGIRAEDQRLELSGYTLDPAALNGWMERLSTSPLLEGQQLAVVKVDRVPRETPGAVSAASRVAGGATLWSYTLVTAVAPPPAGDTGGRP